MTPCKQHKKKCLHGAKSMFNIQISTDHEGCVDFAHLDMKPHGPKQDVDKDKPKAVSKDPTSDGLTNTYKSPLPIVEDEEENSS